MEGRLAEFGAVEEVGWVKACADDGRVLKRASFADLMCTTTAGLVRTFIAVRCVQLLYFRCILKIIHSCRPLQPNSPSMIISKEHRRTIYENLFKGACIVAPAISEIQ